VGRENIGRFAQFTSREAFVNSGVVGMCFEYRNPADPSSSDENPKEESKDSHRPDAGGEE
jgi:hypothetical protein